jgi:hypothetical protein
MSISPENSERQGAPGKMRDKVVETIIYIEHKIVLSGTCLRYRPVMIASRGAVQLAISVSLALSLALACSGGGSDDMDSGGGAAGEPSTGGSSSGGTTGSGGDGPSSTGGLGGFAGDGTMGGMGGDAGAGSGADSGSGGSEETGGGAGTGGAPETGGTGGGYNAVPCGRDADCADFDMVCSNFRNVCVECVNNQDCAGGAVCRRNACESVETCETSLDCSSTDLVCVTGSGSTNRPGVCLECGGDNDCAVGDTCVEGRCVGSCNSDKECTPMGLLCDPDTQTCVECFDNAGCDAADHCSDGSCMADVCEPGRRICLGDDLGVCNDAGSGYEQLDSCFGGTCQEQGGTAQCVD